CGRSRGPNTTVPSLPLARAQGQTANGRRHGSRPRARGLHLGDQSGGRVTSNGVTRPGLWTARAVQRSTGPQPLRCNPDQIKTDNGSKKGSQRKISNQSCRREDGTTAGEFPTTSMWPIIGSTPAFQTGTAPDEQTEMRYPTRASELVDRRLQRSRPLLCTIHS